MLDNDRAFGNKRLIGKSGIQKQCKHLQLIFSGNNDAVFGEEQVLFARPVWKDLINRVAKRNEEAGRADSSDYDAAAVPVLKLLQAASAQFLVLDNEATGHCGGMQWQEIMAFLPESQISA